MTDEMFNLIAGTYDLEYLVYCRMIQKLYSRMVELVAKRIGYAGCGHICV